MSNEDKIFLEVNVMSNEDKIFLEALIKHDSIYTWWVKNIYRREE